MKAYKLHAPKSFGNLLPGEYDEPPVFDNEVKIAVKAVSLNFRDWALASGTLSYPGEKLPFIPFSDASGEVIATGSKVKHLKIGDRVAVNFFPDWHSGPYSAQKTRFALGGTRDGVLAEQVVFEEESVVRIPDTLSYAEAATFPCAAVTAWHALAVEAQLKPGDTILLLGTGGVSVFGLQIAKMFGAKVIITSGSEEKLARAAAMGADHTINYKEENWQGQVKALTGGKGVNYILDVVGHLTDSLNLTKSGGTIFLIGMVGGPEKENDSPNMRQVTLRRLRLQGIYVGSADMLKEVYKAFSANKIKPVIDKTFTFSQVKEALTYMGNGSHFGKIVVNI